MAIPAKFRKGLSKGAVVTRGLDSCLFLYNMEEWEELAERISKLPLSQSNMRAFSRLMLAGAMQVDIDKQGRVVLPEYLRKYAGVKKDAVVTGLYNRVEIWDKAKWTAYNQKTQRDGDKIAETLGELGV